MWHICSAMLETIYGTHLLSSLWLLCQHMYISHSNKCCEFVCLLLWCCDSFKSREFQIIGSFPNAHIIFVKNISFISYIEMNMFISVYNNTHCNLFVLCVVHHLFFFCFPLSGYFTVYEQYVYRFSNNLLRKTNETNEMSERTWIKKKHSNKKFILYSIDAKNCCCWSLI